MKKVKPVVLTPEQRFRQRVLIGQASWASMVQAELPGYLLLYPGDPTKALLLARKHVADRFRRQPMSGQPQETTDDEHGKGISP